MGAFGAVLPAPLGAPRVRAPHEVAPLSFALLLVFLGLLFASLPLVVPAVARFAPAHAVAALEDNDRRALAHEVVGGLQAGEAGADDHDIDGLVACLKRFRHGVLLRSLGPHVPRCNG